MKISFENPDKINGLLTLVVEEEDYKNDVEKTLKDYRKKANVPGFRPGIFSGMTGPSDAQTFPHIQNSWCRQTRRL